jgi:hypothetical protein
MISRNGSGEKDVRPSNVWFSLILKGLLALGENTYNEKSHIDLQVNTVHGLLFSLFWNHLCTRLFWWSSFNGGLPTTKASSQKHKSNLEKCKITSMPWVELKSAAQVFELRQDIRYIVLPSWSTNTGLRWEFEWNYEEIKTVKPNKVLIHIPPTWRALRRANCTPYITTRWTR